MNLYQALKVLDRLGYFELKDRVYPEQEATALMVLKAAARRRPMRIELDYTEEAKKNQEWLAKYGPTTNDVAKSRNKQTALTTWFGNGEHAQTSPEKRDPSAGRKAAKTLERYMLAEIVDLTKEK